MNKYLLSFFLFITISFAGKSEQHPLAGTKIAFLSDVHLQDVAGHPEIIRTMLEQQQSTRLFNENYFAFIAAMEDVVERDIKMVVLPGDLTDDGQEVNVKAMQEILERYRSLHGISFFVTVGNHDPTRPFGTEYKRDGFLEKDGSSITLVSKEGEFSTDPTKTKLFPGLRCEGYEGIFQYLGNFGYTPLEEYRYWETPFTDYSYTDYSFDRAIEYAPLNKRSYIVDPEVEPQPDLSYLVEPIEGLWLLAIDGNCYLPSHFITDEYGEKTGEVEYAGTCQNYTCTLHNKTHLFSWILKVAREAQRLNKVLITFSHYPMTDFNDGATNDMQQLFGMNKMDTGRVPLHQITQQFADAGIGMHFAGHIHIHDTEICTGKYGTSLVNVQVPSLSAYMPAYKLLTIHDKNKMEVETITLESVEGFDSLFPLYEKEYDYLTRTDSPKTWNKDILASSNYMEFCLNHLEGLVRLRFIPQEFPAIAKENFVNMTGKEIMEAATGKTFKGKNAKGYENWTGMDWIIDFYKLRSADKLAFQHMDKERLSQYNTIIQSFDKHQPDSELKKFMELYFSIFHKFQQGKPADHFFVDIETGVITAIE